MKTKESKEKLPVWWEKTVEYKFICECVSRGVFNNVCPLDGNAEIIGDTVISIAVEDAFNKNDKIFIVEFKKTFKNECLKQETDKFKPKNKAGGYNKAKSCFEKSEVSVGRNSHYLIAAVYRDGIFELLLRDYFSFHEGENKELTTAFNEENGMNVELFVSYALSFTSHKKNSFCHYCNLKGGGGADTKPESKDPSGGGGDAQDDESQYLDTTFVLGINPATKNCKIMPLKWLSLLGPGDDSETPSAPGRNNSGDGVKFDIDYENIIFPIFDEKYYKQKEKL
ncbi:hypothetical protein [Serratia fonticola]